MRTENIPDGSFQKNEEIQTINKLHTEDLKVVYKLRSSKRMPYKNEIELIGTTGEYTTGTIINISENGLCFISDSDVPTGTQISARVIHGSETCELEGTIKWSSKNPEDKFFKMGVELVELPDDLNRIYKRIIKKFAVPEIGKKTEKDYTEILRKF